MPVNTNKDAVEWNLDWDDLTDSAPAPPPPPTTASPAPASVASIQPTAPPTPPRLRAFPVPVPIISPATEPANILPEQPFFGSVQPAQAPATPPPLPTAVPAAPAPLIAPPIRSLVRGQRLRLSEILPDIPPPAFAVGLEIAAPSGVTIDRCCFGLDEAGQLSDDRYLVFYNQKSSPGGAVRMRGAWGEVFHVDLALLPASICRLVFTATVDGAGSVRRLGASRFELRALSTPGGARYEFNGAELDDVQALIVAEIYYKDGWRLAAVGQGFTGGLSELLRHFGGQEV